MKGFRAYCTNHDWEGAEQRTKEEAEKDLKAHKGTIPNESHNNSGVLSV